MAGRAFCGYNDTIATKEIAIVRTSSRIPVLTVLLLVACESPQASPPPYAPREVVTLARWRVASAGTALGEVVELEIRDPKQPIRYFRVLDAAGRWLGHATANGRFSRRVPFREDEEDLGVWSMAKGVGLLFEAEAPVTLEPIALDADYQKQG